MFYSYNYSLTFQLMCVFIFAFSLNTIHCIHDTRIKLSLENDHMMLHLQNFFCVLIS